MAIFQYGQKELDYLKKKDKKLGEAIKRIGFIEREVIPDLFTALVNSIVAQQISMKAVDTIWGRMQERFGEITAENMAEQAVEDVQQCGMTMKKAVWIKNIAKAVSQGELNLNELSQLSDEEVCRRLCSLNGIGLWTAEMLMTFSLQRKDVVSWGDLAIRRGMMRLYHHKKLDKAKFERYKKRYSPYGTIASLYLWRLSAE
ncbi:DNA-3-methyladenine glycosylase II [Anaerospora hongkongensis]|uniref:DNA-3-methyladenine glycosylase II n=1 Tax=Anaerospora hongkongensis TaxID=244830 RepID=A0A4R1Q0S6_9FIRM|nr:DNA-3-methyladenine glycosylase [Anaerospora hongkongensis]TCL36923.1 DNA-3-methyladenine glycosylase II [Anaerospora hongkongensis]